ncbi:hypothetical protein HJG60_012097 [Phyllostomus discolor]|uniref:Uncharacterized protein n=1 Tax=Phyllostomus discolor TaxID=89673 RepID=A0A833ZJG0_9CHIR|nr:hypothetical protein HJG60_012097 [Phyllostomus discolor]
MQQAFVTQSLTSKSSGIFVTYLILQKPLICLKSFWLLNQETLTLNLQLSKWGRRLYVFLNNQECLRFYATDSIIVSCNCQSRSSESTCEHHFACRVDAGAAVADIVDQVQFSHHSRLGAQTALVFSFGSISFGSSLEVILVINNCNKLTLAQVP